jgi:hypothetical protein
MDIVHNPSDSECYTPEPFRVYKVFTVQFKGIVFLCLINYEIKSKGSEIIKMSFFISALDSNE